MRDVVCIWAAILALGTLLILSRMPPSGKSDAATSSDREYVAERILKPNHLLVRGDVRFADDPMAAFKGRYLLSTNEIQIDTPLSARQTAEVPALWPLPKGRFLVSIHLPSQLLADSVNAGSRIGVCEGSKRVTSDAKVRAVRCLNGVRVCAAVLELTPFQADAVASSMGHPRLVSACR